MLTIDPRTAKITRADVDELGRLTADPGARLAATAKWLDGHVVRRPVDWAALVDRGPI